jgi:hypothetical protein
MLFGGWASVGAVGWRWTTLQPYEQPPSFFLPPLTTWHGVADTVYLRPWWGPTQRFRFCTCMPLRQSLQEAHRRKQAVSSPQNWSCLLFPFVGPIQRHTRSRQICTSPNLWFLHFHHTSSFKVLLVLLLTFKTKTKINFHLLMLRPESATMHIK